MITFSGTYHVRSDMLSLRPQKQSFVGIQCDNYGNKYDFSGGSMPGDRWDEIYSYKAWRLCTNIIKQKKCYLGHQYQILMGRRTFCQLYIVTFVGCYCTSITSKITLYNKSTIYLVMSHVALFYWFPMQ